MEKASGSDFMSQYRLGILFPFIRGVFSQSRTCRSGQPMLFSPRPFRPALSHCLLQGSSNGSHRVLVRRVQVDEVCRVSLYLARPLPSRSDGVGPWSLGFTPPGMDSRPDRRIVLARMHIRNTGTL